MVVKRYVGEVVRTVDYHTFWQVVGTEWTIGFWSVRGFCEKDNPTIPPTN